MINLFMLSWIANVLFGTSNSYDIRHYLGCYRSFDGYTENISEKSVAKCIYKCKNYPEPKYTFAALKLGESCFCGNEFGNSTYESNCQTKCKDSSEYCGGKYYSVYSLCLIGFHGKDCNKPCSDCQNSIPCMRNNGKCYKSRCQKDSGYKCDVDVDECSTNLHSCNTSISTCQNFYGGYKCECKSGYENKKDLIKCHDIDECRTGKHECNVSNSKCVNIIGSYKCQCKIGYQQDNTGSKICSDIDECSLNICDPKSTTCQNIKGSYSCQCKDGYTGLIANRCTDIDECSAKRNSCDVAISTCRNNDGSYYCECKDGYENTENNITCEDIDECENNTHECDVSNSKCVNINGSYSCRCNIGYQQDSPDSKICSDQNECETIKFNEMSTDCINIVGSYTLLCKYGFEREKDGDVCKDIDECLYIKNYDLIVECTNLEGSFVLRCPSSYTLLREAGRYICKGGCDEAAIQNDQFGSIHFPEGGFNKTVNSTNTCLDSNKTKATATCLKDSTGLFYWKIQEFHCENRSTFSDIKKELAELRENITSDFNKSVEIVLKLAKDNVQNMTTDEIDTMVKFVQDASNVNTTISEEGAKSLVEILDEVMKSPSVVPNKTETPIAEPSIVKTQLGLIGTLEAVVSKIELTTEIFEKDCENFQVKVYEQRTPEDRNFPLNAVPPGSNDDEKSEFQINVAIPKEAFFIAQNKTGKLRANFIVYKSNELFENPSESQRETKIVSNVISGSIAGASISGLKTKINLTFQVENTTESSTCVYADLSSDSWKWSDHGMETIRESGQRKVVCQSDHLTNFAVLAGYKVVNESHSRALTYISIVGMVLSIICLSFLIFTQMFFKKFRKGQYQLALLNLSVALIMVNLLIILGLDRVENVVICSLVAALLHYFLLVSFAWMLIEAILQYYKFVKVFDVHVSSFVLKTTLPAWTLPALVVILTAAIDHRQYSGFDHYCWLADQAFRYAFLLPLGLMVVANTFIFIRIIKGISCDRPKGMQTNQIKSRLVWLQVQAGICCFVVMGLTWCFALFAFGKAALVMHFLFAIFNSMQGCFIFILFCLREKPVRKAWYTLLCPSKMSKKLISGTDSQSSSSLGRFRNRIKKEKAELSISDFSAPPNTDSTDATLSKI